MCTLIERRYPWGEMCSHLLRGIERTDPPDRYATDLFRGPGRVFYGSICEPSCVWYTCPQTCVLRLSLSSCIFRPVCVCLKTSRVWRIVLHVFRLQKSLSSVFTNCWPCSDVQSSLVANWFIRTRDQPRGLKVFLLPFNGLLNRHCCSPWLSYLDTKRVRHLPNATSVSSPLDHASRYWVSV